MPVWVQFLLLGKTHFGCERGAAWEKLSDGVLVRQRRYWQDTTVGLGRGLPAGFGSGSHEGRLRSLALAGWLHPIFQLRRLRGFPVESWRRNRCRVRGRRSGV